VFISELRVDELSDQAQAIIKKLVEQMPDSMVKADNFFTHVHLSGLPGPTRLSRGA
jgi:hypothetical protein